MEESDIGKKAEGAGSAKPDLVKPDSANSEMSDSAKRNAAGVDLAKIVEKAIVDINSLILDSSVDAQARVYLKSNLEALTNASQRKNYYLVANSITKITSAVESIKRKAGINY